MSPPSFPRYSQTAEFSCGAACLVMALAGLEGAEPSRSLELELWREATMIGVRGIDQWGLACPMLERGLPVTVIAEAERTFPRWDPDELAALRAQQAERYPEEELATFTAEDLEVAWFTQAENHRRATAAGVSWEARAPTRTDIREALARGAGPIVLVDLELLGGDWPAPHWVLVTEAGEDEVTVHDPDGDGPGRREMAWAGLERAMDVSTYGAEPTVVVVGPPRA